MKSAPNAFEVLLLGLAPWALILGVLLLLARFQPPRPAEPPVRDPDAIYVDLIGPEAYAGPAYQISDGEGGDNE